jgi:uncharacterized protein YciI
MPAFLCVLRLVPRLRDGGAWSPADEAAVESHFQRLKALASLGQVRFAGRTDEAHSLTFGLVLYVAEDFAAADLLCREDPAVARGVMTWELHPFRLAVEG